MTLRWKIAQWFELQWWKRYLRKQQKASYIAWKKNYWANILQIVSSEIKLDASKTIADIGCGPAGIFIALPENKITAVEPLIDEYENQTSFFVKSDYPNTTFIKSAVEDFQAAQKFDAIFCMNAINHVHNIQQGFEKLKEVCAGDGAIVLSIDAHNYSSFKYLFRMIPGDILHPHQYDLDEYKSLLEKNGWKISTCHLLKQEFFFNHYLLIATKL